MVIMLSVLIGAVVLLMVSLYLLGFRLGGRYWESRISEIRSESAEASRQMHDLTREAFVAMAEHAFRHRGDS
jgi:hypothetical protein